MLIYINIKLWLKKSKDYSKIQKTVCPFIVYDIYFKSGYTFILWTNRGQSL